jgi:hypothetical protein
VALFRIDGQVVKLPLGFSSGREERVGGDALVGVPVVEFDPDRSIAWAPTRHDIDEDTWNHRWGWHLAPDGEGTAVTAFYDCTRVPEDGLRILSRGEWGRPILEASLERLEALVTA